MQGERRSRWWRVAATSGLTLILAVAGACSGSGGDDDGARPQETPAGNDAAAGRGAVDEQRPCRLLTQAEVQAAVGAPVKQPMSAPGAEACTFALASGGGQVLVLSSDAADNPTKFDSYSRGAARPVENLPGVGDRAFLVGGQAYVLKGSVLVGIAVDMRQPEARLNEVARRLVQLAAGRI